MAAVDEVLSESPDWKRTKSFPLSTDKDGYMLCSVPEGKLQKSELVPIAESKISHTLYSLLPKFTGVSH